MSHSRAIAVAFVVALTGCAGWGTHRQSVTVCERGFAKDLEWSRASGAGFRGRSLLRHHPTFVFEGRTSRLHKPSTLWFRNRVSGDIASCSMHSCETGRCVWRVRMYARDEKQWRVRSEYDLGLRRVVSGPQ
jgi:hypothetical protein